MLRTPVMSARLGMCDMSEPCGVAIHRICWTFVSLPWRFIRDDCSISCTAYVSICLFWDIDLFCTAYPENVILGRKKYLIDQGKYNGMGLYKHPPLTLPLGMPSSAVARGWLFLLCYLTQMPGQYYRRLHLCLPDSCPMIVHQSSRSSVY